MANSKVKRVNAAGEATTEKDAIALEARGAEATVVAGAVEEMEIEADEATITTMEAEAAEEISMIIEAEEATMVTRIINNSITSLTFSNKDRPTSPCPA